MRRAVRVGVIGCGYWGPNLIRNFARHPGAQAHAVCDTRFERATSAGGEYRVPSMTDRADELLRAPDLDLVVIATPSFTHYQLARQALLAGKHVLVMKPLTTRADQAEELAWLAERAGVLLAVDHTFVFTGAVRKMKQLIAAGEIGELYYFDSVRINLGIVQTDVNVIWDLGPHDVSIMDYLIGEEPVSVSATAASHGGSPTENIAYVTVRFPGSLIGHVHVNWLAPATSAVTATTGGSRASWTPRAGGGGVARRRAAAGSARRIPRLSLRAVARHDVPPRLEAAARPPAALGPRRAARRAALHAVPRPLRPRPPAALGGRVGGGAARRARGGRAPTTDGRRARRLAALGRRRFDRHHR